MQRRLRLGDLDLCRSEPSAHRAFSKVASEERLAGTVFAAHRLEHGPTAGHRVELTGDRGVEALEADGEQVQTRLRDRAAAERVDHLAATANRDLRRTHRISNCSFSERDVEGDRAARGVCSEDGVPLDIQQLLHLRQGTTQADGVEPDSRRSQHLADAARPGNQRVDELGDLVVRDDESPGDSTLRCVDGAPDDQPAERLPV